MLRVIGRLGVLVALLCAVSVEAATSIKGTVVPTTRVQLLKTSEGASVSADVDLGALALTIPATANSLFNKRATLSASSSVEYDLDGTLTDPTGATVQFTKVYAIALYAESANINTVVIGGAASNAFVGPFADASDKVAVKAKGSALFVNPAGWTVTGSTGDLLKVANGGGSTSVSYRLVVIGEYVVVP